jgi:hypothetical protein
MLLHSCQLDVTSVYAGLWMMLGWRVLGCVRAFWLPELHERFGDHGRRSEPAVVMQRMSAGSGRAAPTAWCQAGMIPYGYVWLVRHPRLSTLEET